MDSSVQWFNAARRIPTLIGKLPSGEQIWGGPYRASQAVTGLVVTLVAFATRGLWGSLIAGPGLAGMATTMVACLVLGGVAGWGAGRLPLGANPLLEIQSAASQGTAATGWRWSNSRLRVQDTYRLRTRPRLLSTADMILPTPTPAPVIDPPEAPATTQTTSTPVAALTPATQDTNPAMTPAQKLAALMEARAC